MFAQRYRNPCVGVRTLSYFTLLHATRSFSQANAKYIRVKTLSSNSFNYFHQPPNASPLVQIIRVLSHYGRHHPR